MLGTVLHWLHQQLCGTTPTDPNLQLEPDESEQDVDLIREAASILANYQNGQLAHQLDDLADRMDLQP